jgi:hypothetical protein
MAYPEYDHGLIMTRLKWAGLLLAAIVVMQIMGLGPGDLWALASARVTQARDDSRALASREYSARVGAAYREEAARIPPPAANLGKDDAILQGELGAARQKLMEDRAAALEKHAGNILRGDVDTLKRDVVDNAKNAGGGI